MTLMTRPLDLTRSFAVTLAAVAANQVIAQVAEPVAVCECFWCETGLSVYCAGPVAHNAGGKRLA